MNNRAGDGRKSSDVVSPHRREQRIISETITATKYAYETLTVSLNMWIQLETSYNSFQLSAASH
jgi:hypothetical protein